MKKLKYVLALVAVLLVGVSLTACGKSTTEKLQSQKWDFTTKTDTMTAKFKKNGTLIVGTQLLTASYDYKVYSPNNIKQEYLMIKDKSDSNRIIKYVYTISDDKNNGYVLKPVQKKMNLWAKIDGTDNMKSTLKLSPKGE